ncbi:hypothetical protein [Paenibacillus bouchesdurhonensis]|uniref:hypothetical protein n=1 Tax=Paenibacillus bouchesdurhonensis TaxID=1870990 RepID=UPI000DA6297C|nr:hypothetical protein [Paenibacillus bouchesdurhonensis]
MCIELGQKFKLKSTGQRLEVCEIETRYILRPVVATALRTPPITEEDLLKYYEPYEEAENQ